MVNIHHLNCVRIVSPINDNVCGHCILVQENDQLILIDTGLGLADHQNPNERIGQQLAEMVGYRFSEDLTALRQIENLGLDPSNVTDCIISHMDNDHIGGLTDFPQATVHLGIEEFESFSSGNPRYLTLPLAHNPKVKTYGSSNEKWFGFEARKINTGTDTEIYLIPLFGHTSGHCGVALNANSKWIFYVADAYYMRIELNDNSHPVNHLAKMRAENDNQRIASLDKIRKLMNEHPEIEVFGYHDIEEFMHYSH